MPRTHPSADMPAIDLSELEDLLTDAISDSFDADWGARIGAKAVIGALKAEGLTVTKAATDWWQPDPEDPFWMLEVRQGFDGAGAWLKNRESQLTTRDPAKAIRFPSWQHANFARLDLLGAGSNRFEPTEHLWVALAKAEAA